MPNEIRKLTQTLMKDPVSVNIEPVKLTTELIEQSVYHVDKKNKPQLLAHLVKELPMYRTIVFTRTKHGADRLVRHLHHRGIKSEAIHGNKTQNARQRALDNFRANKIPVLVATDIASRGIDIDDISHVVNYDITHEPETYVHRIGRTGRAGAKGAAIAFCDRDEMSNLKAIERLLKKTIPVKTDHPVYSDAPVGPQDSRDQQQRPQQPSHLPHRRDRNEHREPHSRPASAPPRGAHRPHAEAGRGAGHSGPVAAQRGFSGKPRGAAAGGGKPKQFGKQRFGRAR
jgi:ATP-dependent RNA helicase RhlE